MQTEVEIVFSSLYWMVFGVTTFVATLKCADAVIGLRAQLRHAPRLR